jgi:ankyrin repeat protein
LAAAQKSYLSIHSTRHLPPHSISAAFIRSGLQFVSDKLPPVIVSTRHWHPPMSPTLSSQNESFGEAAKRFRDAANNGRFDEVRELYERHGSSIVNVSCSQKWTALHDATVHGRVEIVKYLVATCGADIQIANRYGRTAMHYVIYSGQVEIVQYLVEMAGADIHALENYGFSSLHCAAEQASLEIVQYLVEQCVANMNAVDFKGNTPLHMATSSVVYSKRKAIQYLAEMCSANILAVNNAGHTPLYIARDEDDKELVAYLESLVLTGTRNEQLCAASPRT